MKLDSIDKRILRVIQRKGKLQNNELAKEIGLSPSSCLRRTKLMEDNGVIDRYVAILDPKKVHKELSVYVRVWLEHKAELKEKFTHEVKFLPQIMECYVMAGDCDFLLKVSVENLDEYRLFQVNYLSRIAGVTSIKSEIPLQTIKQTTEYQL